MAQSASTRDHDWLAVSGFLLKGGLCLSLLWYFARYLLAGYLWQVMLAVLLTALPLSLSLLHQATVRKLLRRQQLQEQGILFRLFSGRTLSVLLALLGGWIAAVLLLLRLHTSSSTEWLLLAACLPLFALVHTLMRRRLGTEFKPFLVDSVALRWSRLLCPTLLLPVVLLLQNQGAGDLSSTLAQTVEHYQLAVADLQGSAALQQVALVLQTWEALKHYGLALPGAERYELLVLAALLEEWVLLYLVCSMLGTFMLSRSELRRCCGPLSAQDQVPLLPPRSLLVMGAVGSFVLLFIVVPMTAWLELWARQQASAVRAVQQQAVLRLEQIGAAWYRPGTWQSLQQLRSAMLDELDIDRAELVHEVDAAFLAMEGNVDDFLDWYYSLGGEYTRIATLMTGNLDRYLADKLAQTLQQEDAFAAVETMLGGARSRQEARQQQYLQEAQTLLANNLVQPGDLPVLPLRQLTLGDVLTPPVHEEYLQLQTRLLASTTGGATAGVLTTALTLKLGSKVMSKGTFKLAAKALGKLVAGKAGGSAAGAGAGATAGAALGSVVPGLGTAVGALLGGIAGGVLAGIGIDKALLEFEEALNRDEFKAELLAAIRETRAEYLQGLE